MYFMKLIKVIASLADIASVPTSMICFARIDLKMLNKLPCSPLENFKQLEIPMFMELLVCEQLFAFFHLLVLVQQ